MSTGNLVTVAAVQFACCTDTQENLAKAEHLVRAAAEKGADIILLQELFASLYFPIDQVDCSHLSIPNDNGNAVLQTFQKLAKELGVVLPVSFFERSKFVFINFASFRSAIPAYRLSV